MTISDLGRLRSKVVWGPKRGVRCHVAYTIAHDATMAGTSPEPHRYRKSASDGHSPASRLGLNFVTRDMLTPAPELISNVCDC